MKGNEVLFHYDSVYNNCVVCVMCDSLAADMITIVVVVVVVVECRMVEAAVSIMIVMVKVKMKVTTTALDRWIR